MKKVFSSVSIIYFEQVNVSGVKILHPIQLRPVQSKKWRHYSNFYDCLPVIFIVEFIFISQNDQAHFKILAANTAIFLKFFLTILRHGPNW